MRRAIYSRVSIHSELRARPVTIDDTVAAAFAELVAAARGAGRRLKVQDTWIAATASAHGAAV